MTIKGFRYRGEPEQVTGLQLLSDLTCLLQYHFDGRFSSYSLIVLACFNTTLMDSYSSYLLT